MPCVVVWCCWYEEEERKVSKNLDWKIVFPTMVVLTYLVVAGWAPCCVGSVLWLCCGSGSEYTGGGRGGECSLKLSAMVR
jgi:hypothetical protein